MSSKNSQNPELKQENDATKQHDTERFFDGARQSGKPKGSSTPNSVFENYKP